MEAAVRAFEDWEFRVLEQESGLDEEDDGTLERTKQRESEGEMEKEISCQQHAVNAAQVNRALGGILQRISQLLPEALHGFAAYQRVMCSTSIFTSVENMSEFRLVMSDLFTYKTVRCISTQKSDINTSPQFTFTMYSSCVLSQLQTC